MAALSSKTSLDAPSSRLQLSLSFCSQRSVNLICQAQSSSQENSLTVNEGSSSLYNVLYVQHHGQLLQKTGFHLSGLDELNQNPPSLLQAKEDGYEGVIIAPDSLPHNEQDFVTSLRASLHHWKAQGRRGVWLQLPLHLSQYVHLAVKEGFQYHHAEPSYVMMTYWIPNTPSTLPPNASHQVGIGAFVMNMNREVLAVQEKNGPLRGSGIWKMPTGLINQGEDLCAGAVREVKEETGVETEFVQVVGFRHGHHVAFDKSDLYFSCALRPLSHEIVKQDGEIEEAKWIPLEEFQGQSFFVKNEARRKMLDLCVASLDGYYVGFKARELQSSSLAQTAQYFFHETNP